MEVCGADSPGSRSRIETGSRSLHPAQLPRRGVSPGDPIRPPERSRTARLEAPDLSRYNRFVGGSAGRDAAENGPYFGREPANSWKSEVAKARRKPKQHNTWGCSSIG